MPNLRARNGGRSRQGLSVHVRRVCKDVVGGHHDVDGRAVLAAVQASVLRTDRCAAAGLHGVCGQRTSEPLCDGRQGCSRIEVAANLRRIQARDALLRRIALNTPARVYLPRRRRSNADADRRFLPLRDRDERRINLHRRSLQRINHSEHEIRRDVSRTEVNDADERGASTDCGAPEGQVVRDDDPALTCGVFEYSASRRPSRCSSLALRTSQPRTRSPWTTAGTMFSSVRSGKSSGFTP